MTKNNLPDVSAISNMIIGSNMPSNNKKKQKKHKSNSKNTLLIEALTVAVGVDCFII